MTPKQRNILRHLVDHEPDIDELVALFGAGATKQAMQCSLRLLERRRLLERFYEIRDGRLKLVLRPTPRGLDLGRSLPAS